MHDLGDEGLRKADEKRAVLLGFASQCMADDYLELVQGVAPSEQTLDRATLLSSNEKDKEKVIDELLSGLERDLANLGLSALIYVASDSGLIEEQGRIQTRLHGVAGNGKAT